MASGLSRRGMQATTRTRAARRRSPFAAQRRLAWVFIAPLALVNAVVVAGPSIAALGYSFTAWDGLSSPRWIGLGNYRRLIGDETFRNGLWHNVEWTAWFLTVPITMGLVGAFLLSRIRRFQLAFRLLFFIPYVLASVVNAAVWEEILDPDQGIGSQLNRVGIPWLNGIAFFGDTRLALPSVASVDTWHFWGFLVVIFLGAMRAIDSSLYEACRSDGGNAWHEFWHVTLPGLRPTLVFCLVIVTIWSFLTFDYVYIITQGGPAGATDTAATVLYSEAFQQGEPGYAAAMGLSLALVSVVVAIAYRLVRRAGWDV